MASDMRELLEQATETPSASSADVVRIMGRARRMRRMSVLLRACAGVTLAAASVVVYRGVVRTDTAPSLRVGPASPSTLTAPPRGEASAERLADGTPVWVVRHGDDTVSVVSATSTHAPFGLQQLVGWCASSRGFEEGMNGSTWDEYGHRRGGPAPTALPIAPSVLTGRHLQAGSLIANTAVAGQRPSTSCLGNLAAGFDPGTARQHRFTRRDATTLQHVEREVADHPSGHVEFVTGAAIVVAPDNSVRLCPARTSKPETVCTTGPTVQGIDAAGLRSAQAHPGAFIVIRGDLLLRPGAHTVADITFVHGHKIT